MKFNKSTLATAITTGLLLTQFNVVAQEVETKAAQTKQTAKTNKIVLPNDSLFEHLRKFHVS